MTEYAPNKCLESVWVSEWVSEWVWEWEWECEWVCVCVGVCGCVGGCGWVWVCVGVCGCVWVCACACAWVSVCSVPLQNMYYALLNFIAKKHILGKTLRASNELACMVKLKVINIFILLTRLKLINIIIIIIMTIIISISIMSMIVMMISASVSCAVCAHLCTSSLAWLTPTTGTDKRSRCQLPFYSQHWTPTPLAVFVVDKTQPTPTHYCTQMQSFLANNNRHCCFDKCNTHSTNTYAGTATETEGEDNATCLLEPDTSKQAFWGVFLFRKFISS